MPGLDSLFVSPILYDMDDIGAAAIYVFVGKASCLELEEVSFPSLRSHIGVTESRRTQSTYQRAGIGLLLPLLSTSIFLYLRKRIRKSGLGCFVIHPLHADIDTTSQSPTIYLCFRGTYMHIYAHHILYGMSRRERATQSSTVPID